MRILILSIIIQMTIGLSLRETMIKEQNAQNSVMLQSTKEDPYAKVNINFYPLRHEETN